MTTPAYDRHGVTVLHGDCLAVLAELDDASVDVVITDPPYGLAEHRPASLITALTAWVNGDREHVPDGRGFMGRAWDAFVPPPAVWDECLRVLRPGGHLAVFAGSRTVDLMGLSIRLAGFELRDTIGLAGWVYGSGFPKSLDVSKAIDKARDDRDEIVRVTAWLAEQAAGAGVTRAAVDTHLGTSDMGGWWLTDLRHRCALPTPDQWEQLRALIGFGDEMDAEVARLNDRKNTWGNDRTDRRIGAPIGRAVFGQHGNVEHAGTPVLDDAARWQGWGTALKPAWEPIVLARKPLAGTVAQTVLAHGTGALNVDACRTGAEQRVNHAGGTSSLQRVSRVEQGYRGHVTESVGEASTVSGRWPTNAVFTHHPDCGPDEQPGRCVPGCPVAELDAQSGASVSRVGNLRSSARPGVGWGMTATGSEYADSGGASRFFPCFRWEAKAPPAERPRVDGIAHPTVKPVALMRWLVRLLTPPGGLVLDPFAGSGTTGQAARAEGHRALLIERDPTYLPLIAARLDARDRTPATATGEAPPASAEPMDLLDLLDERSA